jgi:H+-transporting ATPase
MHHLSRGYGPIASLSEFQRYLSLEQADCGIAVQGASDAARTAAVRTISWSYQTPLNGSVGPQDVVFLDEGLSTIITAIKVARQIFHRMKGTRF